VLAKEVIGFLVASPGRDVTQKGPRNRLSDTLPSAAGIHCDDSLARVRRYDARGETAPGGSNVRSVPRRGAGGVPLL